MVFASHDGLHTLLLILPDRIMAKMVCAIGSKFLIIFKEILTKQIVKEAKYFKKE
jgi:hypothetical protein